MSEITIEIYFVTPEGDVADVWPSLEVPNPMTAEDIERVFDIKLYEEPVPVPNLRKFADAMAKAQHFDVITIPKGVDPRILDLPEDRTIWPERTAIDARDIERQQALVWDIVEWGDTEHYCITCPVEGTARPKSNFFLWKDGTIRVNSTGLQEYEQEHGVEINRLTEETPCQFSLAKGYYATRKEAEIALNGWRYA